MAIQNQDVERFLADERFSRVFTFPADPAEGRPNALPISYADFGYHNVESSSAKEEKVFLFFGPLLGSRMLLIAKDALAKDYGVRVICADRPGFGDTPDVEAEGRLAFWRNAIFALLQHLQIRHVHVGAQSAGTIYALDFIFHYPELLYPDNAYLAIGAPWIHPSHSRIWHMSITHALPKPLLGQVDKLASLFSVVSAPILDTSFGLTSAFGRWFTTQPAEDVAAATPANPAVAFAEALDPKLADFIYARPIHGMSNESILLMKKTQGGSESGWADWGDCDTLVPRLRRTLAEKNRRLIVECFFSQTDSMIGNPGTVGPEWFKGCWTRDGSEYDDAIQFSCRVINGADHNSIWATQWNVTRDVFDHIRGTQSKEPNLGV
ncbi:interferon-induced GTP-binding protein Mx2 [Colletotrichum truncatum]|uniref:Interferon-induced GTP-binding protein Mx2 n=1 Tax=Colletotrichum truncatum TaxID=5467 RepID=A0ACC3YD89_COLTU|nr:interferon-induced GTP-binding protein Mx2 [Colletotrichum truncatum]KAF6784823.1 interferon-induced GTP-binding protein Mx2 [Colletotrichum truncatum]